MEGGALCCIIILAGICRMWQEVLQTSAHVVMIFIHFFYSPNIISVCKQVNGEEGVWRRFRYNVNMRVKTVSCTANFQCEDEQWVLWLRHLFDRESLQGR